MQDAMALAASSAPPSQRGAKGGWAAGPLESASPRSSSSSSSSLSSLSSSGSHLPSTMIAHTVPQLAQAGIPVPRDMWPDVPKPSLKQLWKAKHFPGSREAQLFYPVASALPTDFPPVDGSALTSAVAGAGAGAGSGAGFAYQFENMDDPNEKFKAVREGADTPRILNTREQLALSVASSDASELLGDDDVGLHDPRAVPGYLTWSPFRTRRFPSGLCPFCCPWRPPYFFAKRAGRSFTFIAAAVYTCTLVTNAVLM